MQTIFSDIVIVILGIWLVATLALQVPHVRPWLREREACVLIPEYRFFAPHPSQGDFHLLFRDFYAENRAGKWTEVCLPKPRRLIQAIWHPDKRERKAVFDAVTQLLELGLSTNASTLTTPYLLMLNYVSSIQRTLRAEYTQFAVVQSYGWGSKRPAEVILVSSLHKLP